MTKNRANKRILDRTLFHISLAEQPIRTGLRLAYMLKLLLGEKLAAVPGLSMIDGPISALIALNEFDKSPAEVPEETAKCDIASSQRSDFELIVVGSGPGGAISAARSSSANVRTLIIERGRGLDASIGHHTPTQMKRFFSAGGQQVVLGWPAVPFAQAQVVGGGSEINSGLYHRLPSEVADSWSRAVPCFTDHARKKAEKEIEQKLCVATQSDESLGPYHSSPIRKLGEILGWAGGVIPRWRTYQSSKFKHHGMVESLLQEATENGAQILSGHNVEKLRVRRSHVLVQVKGDGCRHIFKASQVCISAGTVETPRLLVASRLARVSQLKFGFHAMFREVAEFDYPVNDLVDIDPHQYWNPDRTLKIGAAVGTSALLASTLASKRVKIPGRLDHLGTYYISLPFEGSAGFIRIGMKIFPWCRWDALGREKASGAIATLRQALEQSGGRVLGSKGFFPTSVHIFSSIPLGSARGIVDDLGNVARTNGRVFIRDASLLPSAPRVNPQGPLMHLMLTLEDERLRRQV